MQMASVIFLGIYCTVYQVKFRPNVASSSEHSSTSIIIIIIISNMTDAVTVSAMSLVDSVSEVRF